MKGIGTIFTLWACCWASLATDLCGGADVKICLTSSARFTVNAPTLFPGTRFVFTVPGVGLSNSGEVAGAPTEAYRLEPNGQVTDNQGGLWTAVQVLDQDQRGATAVSFRLEDGNLQSPTIDVQDMVVCQLVGDGPADVSLNVLLLANFGGQTKTLINRKMEDLESSFQACSENSGPVPFGDEAWNLAIHNPHNEEVMLSYGANVRKLKANERVILGREALPLSTVSSSLPLTMVAVSNEEDLNLVSLTTDNGDRWFIPHLARTGAWENQFIFSASKSTVLNWNLYNRSYITRHQAGFNQLKTTVEDSDPASWAEIQSNEPLNGFFQFSRSNGQGGAWIRADKRPEARTLYIPHVSTAVSGFWTGLSLANPNDVPAQVVVTPYGRDGAEMPTINLFVEAGANLIGLIGEQGVIPVTQASWFKVESDMPISGLALVGSEQAPWFSGYLLPEYPGDNLSFPFINTGENAWTGLALVNVSNATQTGPLTFYDAHGAVVSVINLALEPGLKFLQMAPQSAAYAAFQGSGVIGFCLVGETASGKIGGYLGSPFN